MAKKTTKKASTKPASRKRDNSNSIEMIITTVLGITCIGFGGFGIFTGIEKVSTLALIAGYFLLGLSIVDFIGLFRANKSSGKFAFSLIKAGSELLIAILTIVNNENGMTWPLTLLSVYVIGQGVLQVMTALAFISNKTERFFWIVCGAVGCLLGIIALNSGSLADRTSFFRIFSIYMAIYGVTSLVSLVYKAKK